MSSQLSEIPRTIVPFEAKGYDIKISPKAVEYRDLVLSACKGIIQIPDDTAQQEAVDIIARAKGMMKDTEKTRSEIKEPFLRAGQSIDQTAKSFASGLTAESARLERLVGSYQHSKVLRAQQEQRERERIAAEAIRKQQEAEAERIRLELAAEDARLAAEAAKGRAKANASKQAEEAQKAADKAKMDAEIAEFDAMESGEHASTVVHESAKPVGATVSESEFVFEIEDMPKFLSFCIEKGLVGDLLKIEPKIRPIRDYIVGHFVEKQGELMPGLIVSRVTKVHVRAASSILLGQLSHE